MVASSTDERIRTSSNFLIADLRSSVVSSGARIIGSPFLSQSVRSAFFELVEL